MANTHPAVKKDAEKRDKMAIFQYLRAVAVALQIKKKAGPQANPRAGYE